ncbi:PREDICTED: uncharacterized protein LOC109487123 [Branchiostoma belcheri]|uniref:Uncharacterized protein LOC109487123 n=1 Tax=Branchiostoma belcheri TaxID=7741 RepID=A0A6P5AK82_BRABE|nr:PREDICTED: uncharacterized protein LOC109487123 [Branchiostoma belcheri]
MSAEGSVAQEAEHAGISRMPMSPARPVDIQAVRPRRWREPNSDWRTVVRPPTKPSGDSPYIAPDLSGLKISADVENSTNNNNNNNNAFRIDVSLLRQKQGDSTPEQSVFSASTDVVCSSTNEKTTSPRLSISEWSISSTPAAPKAPKLKPQLGKNDTRGRAAQARLSTSSSAIPVRATFQYPSAQAPSGNRTVQYRHRGEDPPGNGTVQYSPASPREELPPRPRTRRGRDEDRRLSLETSEQPNGVAVTENSDTVVHPPPGASRPRFRRPRTMYRVAACQDMSVYIKMAAEERKSSTTETATTTEARRELSGTSDTSTGYAEVLKIAHGETQSRLASDSESTPGYSRVLFSEIPPKSENGVEENVQMVETDPTLQLEDDKDSETNPYKYRNVTGSESEQTLLLEHDRSVETNPYEYRNVAGFDPDEYILDLFDQGRITAVQKRHAYSSGVEFPDSAYHIEQMFGIHGEQNALFLDNNLPVSTARQPSYSFDDHARDLDLLVGAGNAHNTMDDIIYSYEHGGLGNGGTSGHRSVRDDDRAWSKLLVDLTEVEGLLESSDPPNVRGRRQGTQASSSGRKKQKKGKKKGSTKKTANGTPERRKSATELSSRVLDSRGTTLASPGLNELKLTPPGETKLTAMYSETPEARRYREVQGVNRYVTMMDNRKSILDQFGPDPTGNNKRKCAAKPRPAPRPHDPVSAQLEGTEEMYHADMPSTGGTPMTENTQNAIAFLYGDKETFERRPSGFFTNAAMDAELGELRRDLGDDWASDFMD